MQKSCSSFSKFAYTLAIIGALNWGLWGLFKLDLVEFALSGVPGFQNIVYILIGIAGLYLAIACCGCKSKK